MNVIGGRGGPFTAFFGLLAFFVVFAFKVAMYIIAVAMILVLLIAKGIQLLWLHHRAQRLESRKKIFDSLEPPEVDAPMPVMSRVGPRDWTPPR